MQETKIKELSLTQEILNILKESGEEDPEGYTGAEWIEAALMLSLLKEPIILAVPWCIFDLEVDEFGVPKLESKYDHLGRRKDLDDDGNVDPDWEPGPKRRSRNDVLAILAHAPMKREIPDITVEAIQGMMNNDNISGLTTKIFKFWGVDTEAFAERIEKLTAESIEEDETIDERIERAEATKPVNFQESPSKRKPKKSQSPS